ncbi:hypothetical protein ACIOEW_32045 [Streptomyces sp. NPDC087901]|uniref:hypothetical protein n=1 Tax=unclassified Streptomyces TaxID=2593676 RepID=UPI003427C89A
MRLRSLRYVTGLTYRDEDQERDLDRIGGKGWLPPALARSHVQAVATGLDMSRPELMHKIAASEGSLSLHDLAR